MIDVFYKIQKIKIRKVKVKGCNIVKYLNVCNVKESMEGIIMTNSRINKTTPVTKGWRLNYICKFIRFLELIRNHNFHEIPYIYLIHLQRIISSIILKFFNNLDNNRFILGVGSQ